MPAAGLADVIVGDSDPPVAVGLGGHRLDHAAILLLDLAPAAELGLRLAEPGSERVAHPLQLGDPEHPGPANRPDRPLHSLAREGGGEQLAEPLLQQGDLPAKILAGTTLGEDVDPSGADANCCLQGIRRLKRRIARLDLQHFVGHEGLHSPGIYVGAHCIPLPASCV